MRLTADEILEQLPSMNASGRHYNTVVGRYYGDLPYKTLSTEFSSPNDRTMCNIEGVDVFVARTYAPQVVEKYMFNHGEGEKIKGGPVIAANIDIKYGNGHAYNLQLFNNHLGHTGFSIGRNDVGKCVEVSYMSSGWQNRTTVYRVRDVISEDILEVLFRRVERSDDYGKFARQVIQTVREIHQADLDAHYVYEPVRKI